MATLYPSQIDNNSTLPNNKAEATITALDHAPHHDNLADAIIAVETALGVNPFGAFASVAAALLNKVSTTPSSTPIIQPQSDIAALAVRGFNPTSVANLFEARISTSAIVAFIDSLGGFSAQSFKVGGTPLNSSHLADQSALARLASPTFTGTPAAPTPSPGDNTTKLATTSFVTAAITAAAPPPTTIGTSLPGSPTNGQEAILTDSLTNPTYAWTFQWVSGAAKWYFIGGSSARSEIPTSESTASSSYVDLATVGPTFTLPRAGTYVISWGLNLSNPNGPNTMTVAIKRGTSAAQDSDGTVWTQSQPQILNAIFGKTQTFAGAVANDVYKLQYKTSGGTLTAFNRWMTVLPVFVT